MRNDNFSLNCGGAKPSARWIHYSIAAGNCSPLQRRYCTKRRHALVNTLCQQTDPIPVQHPHIPNTGREENTYDSCDPIPKGTRTVLRSVDSALTVRLCPGYTKGNSANHIRNPPAVGRGRRYDTRSTSHTTKHITILWHNTTVLTPPICTQEPCATPSPFCAPHAMGV